MLIELENITKTFESPSGKKPLTVLKNICFSIKQGESVAVVGPSGSGKSTLLNIIGALDKPTSGSILFQGKNLTDMEEEELAGIRNKKIGFVFQMHHLLPQCTVLENVLIPTIPQDRKNRNDEAVLRAKDLLKKAGLSEHLDYFPAQLSGGEQQRVAVVRALINKPNLILADEPTGSLDQTTADSVSRILIDLNKSENATLIMVTHSMDLANKMDAAYSLIDGHLEKNIKSA